jgi:hypothetical protein
MGPSNRKYKSMYCNESEVGVGNSCKLSRRVYFGLFHTSRSRSISTNDFEFNLSTIW